MGAFRPLTAHHSTGDKVTVNRGWTSIVALLLALIGLVVVLAAAGIDLLVGGTPGVGVTQIVGMAIGLVIIGLAHLMARSGGPGFDRGDIPSVLGLLAVGGAALLILLSPRETPPENPFGSYAIGDRMLDLEAAVRAPRRGVARCYPSSEAPPEAVGVEPVVSGFTKPVHVTTAGDGSGRLFVTEKGGSIRIAEGGRMRNVPFLDIRSDVYSDENPAAAPSDPEQGMLSSAFPPDFQASGRFYVFYTGFPDGLLTLSRFQVGEDRNRADPESEEKILTVETVGPIHNAGQLQFGPDGYLYVAVGDGGGWRWPTGDPDVYGDGAVELTETGEVIIPPGSDFTEDDYLTADQWNQAQDLGTLRGKILRLDVSVDSGYAIPPDNPYADDDQTTREEIWAYGFRNPWRFSIDDCDGALFAGDVGQARYEEINLVEPGGNYGWRVMEGAHCYNPGEAFGRCDTRGLKYPIAEYQHLSLDPDGGNAVVGGYVYRGRQLPSLVGRYVFADYMSARVWTLTPTARSPSGWRMEHLTTLPFLPTSFGLDAEGELLVVGFGGTIYRLIPAGGDPVAG